MTTLLDTGPTQKLATEEVLLVQVQKGVKS